MITRWLVTRREEAITAWVPWQKTVTIMTRVAGSPFAVPAILEDARVQERAARRRLRFWDLLLDIWTLNGRR